jgi:hypothetical protein
MKFLRVLLGAALILPSVYGRIGSIIWLALVFLWPLASRAVEVDIPEMGIRIAGLPSGASARKPRDKFDAYFTEVRIGNADLEIYRLEEPVPAGATLTDASYRKGVPANFGDNRPKLWSKATFLSGHPAWTTYWGVKLSGAYYADYNCITYVIADQHLYRLRASMATSWDPHGPERPADFDAAVQAMSNITFEPISRPVDAPGSSPGPPRFVSAGYYDLYPGNARGNRVEGVVDFEFRIDGKGHVRDFREIYSSSPGLGSNILGSLKNGVFKVPANWEERGLQNLLFTEEYEFRLVTGPHSCEHSQPPRLPDAILGLVCTSVP